VITFRYHVVSIVAVLLALAVGLALGGGLLQGTADTSQADQGSDDSATTADLREQVEALNAGNRFTDDFASTVAPGLVGDSLSGRSVTVVALPSARQDDVSSLKRLVGVAGGSVAGTVRVGAPLVDAKSKQLVDELGTQLEDRAKGLQIPADAGPYERIGALVARAVGTDRKGGARVDGASTSILSGLGTASLMSVEGKLSRRGDLVLFVTGPGQGSADDQRGAATIVTELTKAVDAGTGGVVLAGPEASARGNGQVKAVRADVGTAREVSTVDSLGRTAGQVVTVMALAGQAAGETGQYGAVEAADGAMPGARSTSQ
jgi:copper transport outer membrane protein MctB